MEAGVVSIGMTGETYCQEGIESPPPVPVNDDVPSAAQL